MIDALTVVLHYLVWFTIGITVLMGVSFLLLMLPKWFHSKKKDA